MLVSFILELKPLCDINEKTPSSIFIRDTLSFIPSESYLVSKILGSSLKYTKIKKYEKFKIRITTLNDESFKVVIMNLFKKKLLEERIKSKGYSFVVENIYSSDNKVWCNNLNDLILTDSVSIYFSTPLILRYGDNYLKKFDIFLFLKSILKRIEKEKMDHINPLKNYELLKISEDIQLVDETYLEKKILKKREYSAILGELRLDLSALESIQKNRIKELLKTGHFISIGQETKSGFGMYKIKSVDTFY